MRTWKGPSLGTRRGALQGDDPAAHDNRRPRESYEDQSPLIYFFGISETRYEAICPAFVTASNPGRLSVQIEMGDQSTWAPAEPGAPRGIERRDATREPNNDSPVGFPGNDPGRQTCAISPPWHPPEDTVLDGLPLLAGLFNGEDLVNLCPEHGVGITRTSDDWMRFIRDNGAPSGTIGCMFRPNPVSRTPTGEKGGWTDNDVTAHRFAVLESDLLPLELQPDVIARLPLPVAAIIFSGGKSYHALVRVNASDALAYRRDVGRMTALLRSLGFPDRAEMVLGAVVRTSR